MNKLKSFSAITSTLLLFATVATADMAKDKMDSMDHSMHEKCKVMDKNGKNLVKADMSDALTDEMNKMASSSDEMDAWIWVPKGWCAQVNGWVKKGEWDKVPEEVKKKLKMN